MVERRRIIKVKRKSPCELCEDELGKEGSFYNRETKKCDCKREEGYLLDKPNSRCIKCSGNGAFIKFGKCHCGAGSVFKNELSNCVCPNETEWNGKLCEPLCDEEEHLQLKNGLCVCKEGFLESTDEGCVPCSGPTSHLVEGFCACGENHLLDESKCIECGGLGAFVVDHQCSCELQHYRLSPSSKVCHCPSDFVLTPTGSCLPCVAGLVSNNTCTCPADHLYHSQSVSCIKCISGTLSAEGNCTCHEKHELLESEARCVKCFGDGSSLDQLGGHCTCEGSSLLSFSGQCIKCSGPGASIKEGTETCTCLNGILNSESECVTCNGPGSYLTKKGKCKCKKKSKLSADGTCVPCYGEGKLLDGVNCICDTGYIQSENGDCIRCEGEGSFLKGDKCSCDHDFVLSENKCVKCHGAGSFLSASGDCSCHEGFILSDDKSSCARCEGPGAFIQGQDTKL